MRLLSWRSNRSAEAPAGEPVAEQPKPKLRSPIELYESTGRRLDEAPSRTQEILRLAEESHHRHQRLRAGTEPDDLDPDMAE
jgi:hypothetical protein